ncbi:hypothetical protein BMS3Abin17_01055 [archaeon BMS3Abin17]|nr:hypothetical protein BMS3Abin17_01055 [archaeon BMS3Abin17]HDZ60739.1 hypothetical protein [Candidatus Pacearchaeota archaeon]
MKRKGEEVKERILDILWLKPLTIQQISNDIDSNWLTVEKFVKELGEEGRIKEVISTEKLTLYQKVMGDTYFDFPITDEQRKKFRTLFYIIKQEYKKHGRIPSKTHLAKCAVHVIDNKESGLNDLPIVWYLYGMVPQIMVDPTAEYHEEYNLKHKVKVQNLIKEFADENRKKGSVQIQKEQHKKYGEELYVLSDEIFNILNKSEWKNQEIENLLNKFFIACPVNPEFPEIFDLTEKAISIMGKMNLIGLKLQDYRKEIFIAFDSLWKLIALYKLYKSKTTGSNVMEKEIIMNFYLGNIFEDRKRTLKEALSDLNSIYITNLANFDVDSLEVSKEVQEIRKIMENWTGED